MKFDELIKQIAADTDNSQSVVRDVLKALGTTIQSQAAAGHSLRVPGVGTFDQSWSEPRVVRNIKTGRRSLVDGRFRVRFRPAKGLRTAVADRAPRILNRPEHQKAWQLADTLLADLAMYGALTSFSSSSYPEDAALRGALQSQAGSDWDATLQSYQSGVPEALRAECDHLVLAARHRFR